MVLNLQQTYEYGQGGLLQRQVAAGAYSNVRIYNWNGGIYPIVYGLQPAFATTHGSMDTLGGAWLNSTYAATINDDSSNFAPGKSFRSFSAPCWYFAQKLTDLLGAKAPPIGLVLASMGGVTVESFSANETVASCIETNPGSSGAPVAQIFYGSVTPFVNMSVSGYVWYQGWSAIAPAPTPKRDAPLPLTSPHRRASPRRAALPAAQARTTAAASWARRWTTAATPAASPP